jgi:hypothetical protein
VTDDQKQIVQISLRLDEALLDKIDEARGMIPRNRLLVSIIEQHFAGSPPVITEAGESKAIADPDAPLFDTPELDPNLRGQSRSEMFQQAPQKRGKG